MLPAVRVQPAFLTSPQQAKARAMAESEVMRAIFGADRFASGTISLDGKVFRPAKPGDAIRALCAAYYDMDARKGGQPGIDPEVYYKM